VKILLTGATGFIGSHLVKRFHELDHETIILSRDVEYAQQRLPTAAKIYPWNSGKERPPGKAFDGVYAVIHLAGENLTNKRWSQKQKEKILNSRVTGTQHLVQAINELEYKPKVLVSTSAIGIYSDRNDELLTEESPTPNDSFLTDVCLKWEEEARQVSVDVRVCYMRVGIVLAKDGGALKKMLLPFKLGLGGRLASGNQWMSWIHIKDMVNLFVYCATSGETEGIYNGVSPRPVTNRVFTNIFGKVIKRPTIFPMPAFALKMALGEMSTVLLSSVRCQPDNAIQEGFEFEFEDLESALIDILK